MGILLCALEESKLIINDNVINRSSMLNEHPLHRKLVSPDSQWAEPATAALLDTLLPRALQPRLVSHLHRQQAVARARMMKILCHLCKTALSCLPVGTHPWSISKHHSCCLPSFLSIRIGQLWTKNSIFDSIYK